MVMKEIELDQLELDRAELDKLRANDRETRALRAKLQAQLEVAQQLRHWRVPESVAPGLAEQEMRELAKMVEDRAGNTIKELYEHSTNERQ